MLEINRALSFFFFQQKFVNKDKFSCSDDDDASASTSPSPSPHLSPSPRLSSAPSNYRNKDDDVVDGDNEVVDGEVVVDDGNDGVDDSNKYEYEWDGSYDPEEERRSLGSLMTNYDIVRKKI